MNMFVVSTIRVGYLIIKQIRMFLSLGSETAFSEEERCASSIKCLSINQLHSHTISFEDMGKGQGSCSRRIFYSAIERHPSPNLQEMVSGTITIIYFPRGHICSESLLSPV